MKKNIEPKHSEISIDDLQKIFMNNSSVKKMHEESEKIIKRIKLPESLISSVTAK
jgi:hypothetical protein